ncbi:MAG: diguanylate cyclase [Candidatus Aminicenantes bacterium]|nr:diguanylate cyclase [Candidatus Aminicenantes bacterium]
MKDHINKIDRQLMQELLNLQQKVIDLELQTEISKDAGKKLRKFCDKLKKISQTQLDELKQTNLKLQDELAERKKAENALQESNSKLTQSLTQLEQRNLELTYMTEMGELIQACLTMEEAFSISSRFLNKIFPKENGAVFLSGKSANIVEAVVVWGESLKGELVFSRDDCWAFRKGHIHIITGSSSGDICRHIGAKEAVSYICIPMMAQGNAIGMLHLQRNISSQDIKEEIGGIWPGEKKRLMTAVAEHLSLAFANLKLQESLRQQAIHDSLTGLYNRRYLMEMLEREVRRAVRSRDPVGVIMLDLDHFKKINDNYGHESGDVVLQEVGRFLQTHVRQEDIVCRYGGEEFIVIMPGTSLEVCKARARSLWEGIKNIQIQVEGYTISHLSVSIGIAMSLDNNINDASELLRMADAALYKAKEKGRDTIVIAEK